MTRPFEALRDRKLARLEEKYQAFLVQGFPTPPFEGEPEPETLQCRNAEDRTNWLELRDTCREMAAAGFGDQLVPLPIRCTSNREYQVTANDALERLALLKASVAGVLLLTWRLKDAIRSAPSRQALEAIDLDEGWA